MCKVFDPRTHVLQAIDPLGSTCLCKSILTSLVAHQLHTSRSFGEKIYRQFRHEFGQLLAEVHNEGTGITRNETRWQTDRKLTTREQIEPLCEPCEDTMGFL